MFWAFRPSSGCSCRHHRLLDRPVAHHFRTLALRDWPQRDGGPLFGDKVDRIKLVIYTLSGLMAGIAGVIFVSRVSTTRSDMGMGLELDVIAAVVLGGTSIFGGIGTIAGTVLGFTLIQLLKNGLALTGVKGDATIVVIGTVLILSILITNFLQHRRGSEG
jgi:rhamnose transport system permease protein